MNSEPLHEKDMPADLAAALHAVERAIRRTYGMEGNKVLAVALTICWQGRDLAYLSASTMLNGSKDPDVLLAMIDQLGRAFGAEVELTDVQTEAVH
jgi:hypothetical protein